MSKLVLVLGCICALLHGGTSADTLNTVTLEQAQVMRASFVPHNAAALCWRTLANTGVLLVLRRTLAGHSRSGYRSMPSSISMMLRCPFVPPPPPPPGSRGPVGRPGAQPVPG